MGLATKAIRSKLAFAGLMDWNVDAYRWAGGGHGQQGE
jgi:hypothetical protein